VQCLCFIYWRIGQLQDRIRIPRIHQKGSEQVAAAAVQVPRRGERSIDPCNGARRTHACYMIRPSLLLIKFYLITFSNLFNLHTLLCPCVQRVDHVMHQFTCSVRSIERISRSRAVLSSCVVYFNAARTPWLPGKKATPTHRPRRPRALWWIRPWRTQTSADPPSPYSSCVESPRTATRLPRIRCAWDPPVTELSSPTRHDWRLTRRIFAALGDSPASDSSPPVHPPCRLCQHLPAKFIYIGTLYKFKTYSPIGSIPKDDHAVANNPHGDYITIIRIGFGFVCCLFADKIPRMG
jgi:hypothetical protein